MTRVSLREAYDNKDVVAQIYAIRDTAESAEDTAEQAVTTANTASDHVDALVPQVEGAVQNANSASASAQASAQTVAGYDGRLTEVEGDLNAVTLRVTTAEGQIVTIEGRVTALETADGQNVKLTGEHAIGNYAVLLTDNQGPILGIKTFAKPPTLALHESGSNNQNGWRKIFVSPSFATSNEENGVTFEFLSNAGQYGLFSAFGRNGSLSNITRRAGNFPLNNVKMSIDSNNEVTIWSSSYRTIGIVNIEAHAGNNVVTFADSGTIATFPEPTTDSYRQVITAIEG